MNIGRLPRNLRGIRRRSERQVRLDYDRWMQLSRANRCSRPAAPLAADARPRERLVLGGEGRGAPRCDALVELSSRYDGYLTSLSRFPSISHSCFSPPNSAEPLPVSL